MSGTGLRPALERLAELRAAARREAEAELRERGFAPSPEGEWRGNLVLPGADGERVPHGWQVLVSVPHDFPDCLPEVLVAPESLSQTVAHVDGRGKICIARESNLLLDSSRPRALLREALARAASTLADGLSGRSSGDLAVEFLAYWDADGRAVWSILDSEGPGKAIALTELHRGKENPWLAAESHGEASEWAARAGFRSESRGDSAYLLRLDAVPTPPARSEGKQGQWLETLKDAADTKEWDSFRQWIGTIRLPGFLFFSIPARGSEVRTLAAIELAPPRGGARELATHGFRPGRVPAARELGFARDLPLAKLRLIRLDRRFIQGRGGEGMNARAELLSAKRVVLIGCGAVGSHLAEYIAGLGIGTLGLIDDECLESGNLQRHALGVEFLGVNKASALASALGRHYPHQRFVAREKRVEAVLQDEPAFIADADLVIVALGEPTLERRLNETLGIARPRVHTWLEPLGIGGHVLVTGLGAPGCYECLFETDNANLLTNRADLAAPGQDFNQSMAGCSGSFSPFTSLDAARTAQEAVELCASALSGELRQSLLFTWRGERGEFEEKGFRLSARGESLEGGSRVRRTDFARLDCATCLNGSR